ncbi:hypothetical protein HYH03_014090 [Edaphochlamys debaryana]|uniref:Uncharacterized protein n=1 Tax=Edaphochlamys debaryana TaxID=47281 RepID=A0A835XND3_9CHLO|nr:hypothetical protein HYH03_014090 [Edaphochlamys debaryana]|eukprot:KAG2487248.1 hypothetical protein HYH03_014090 [Edaphochlamys debaryana]
MAPSPVQLEELDTLEWNNEQLHQAYKITWQKYYVGKIGFDLASVHWHPADQGTGHRRGLESLSGLFYSLQADMRHARNEYTLHAWMLERKMAQYRAWDRYDAFRQAQAQRQGQWQEMRQLEKQRRVHAIEVVREARGE